jgi:hypothetical protein
MKGAWFSVICEVQNGLTVNKISRVVYALTASEAKHRAKTEFADDGVKILDAYKISGTNIFVKGEVE